MLDKKKDVVLLYNPRIVPAEKAISTVFMPPISLLALASPLVGEGIQTLIWDGNFSDDDQIDQIDFSKVICCGITAMTGPQIMDGIAFAQRVKALSPNMKIVWGGVHVNLMPAESIRSDWVDIIVLGQGEASFLQVVQTLQAGQELGSLQGIYAKVNGELYHNDDRLFVDITQYPMLPYELLEMKRYLKETHTKRFRTSDAFDPDRDIFLYYYSSVGCPFACKFCASSVHAHRKWTGFSPERVLSEIESLIQRYKVTFVQMVDAEFFIDHKRALAIAKGFIQRQFNIKWKAQIRADALSRLSDKDLQVLRESGYIHAEIGVESGSSRLLSYIDKRITPNQVIEGAMRLKKNNIVASFIFIFGLPGETQADIEDTFRLAKRLKQIMPECLLPIYFFTPFPGVPLYYDAINLGMNPPGSFEEWGETDFNMREYCQWVPWLNQKYVDKCHKAFIFYLPLAYPANITLGTITMLKDRLKKGKFRIVWKLLHKSALLRAVHNNYKIPIEWYVFKMFKHINNILKLGR